LRRIGDERIGSGDAANRRVEMFEEFIGNARGDLRAITE
jgi:hypothetical protein